jgi:hypothetical protein|eukprot:COSAG06_NODE_324_length_17552_cov_11.946370_15_plen_44_part_00
MWYCKKDLLKDGTLKICCVAATSPLICKLKPPSVSRYCGSQFE